MTEWKDKIDKIKEWGSHYLLHFKKDKSNQISQSNMEREGFESFVMFFDE